MLWNRKIGLVLLNISVKHLCMRLCLLMITIICLLIVAWGDLKLVRKYLLIHLMNYYGTDQNLVIGIMTI